MLRNNMNICYANMSKYDTSDNFEFHVKGKIKIKIRVKFSKKKVRDLFISHCERSPVMCSSFKCSPHSLCRKMEPNRRELLWRHASCIISRIYFVDAFWIWTRALTLITAYATDKLINCKRTTETLSKQRYYFMRYLYLLQRTILCIRGLWSAVDIIFQLVKKQFVNVADARL